MSRSIDDIRQEVWSRFREMQSVYFATAEADQPRVRPVTLLNLDRKFWIATSMRSAKARQVRRNPNVEFCLPLESQPETGYIRVGGLASIVTDRETIRSIGSQLPFLAEYWEGVDDPDLCLLRITRVEVEYMKPGDSEPTTFLVQP